MNESVNKYISLRAYRCDSFLMIKLLQSVYSQKAMKYLDWLFYSPLRDFYKQDMLNGLCYD